MEYRLADSLGEQEASRSAIGNVVFGDEHPELPRTVTAGTPVSVTLTLNNNASFISPTDSDVCFDVGGGSGYRTKVSAFANGEQRAEASNCFPSGETWTWELDLGTFDPGSYALRFTATGGVSGRVADEFTHTLNVEPTEDSDDPPANDPPSGSGLWASLSRSEKQVAAIGGAAALYALTR